MSDNLVVRMYNIRFGDAILVTVPDKDPSTGRTTTRRILIDVGNAPKVAGTGQGGSDEVFENVVGDILNQLDGHPLDLYVMSHEHLDHVQGLFFASTKLPRLDLPRRLRVRHVWLTASAAPDYYDKHPKAKEQHLAFEAMYRRVAAHVAARPTAATLGVLDLLANNDPTKTRQCVDFLRTLCPDKTHYIHREARLRGTHPFREARLSVWAPEEDTSEYYGRFLPLDAGAVPPAPAGKPGERRIPRTPDPLPPQGVDVGALLGPVRARRSGAIDTCSKSTRRPTNTSIVFALEWRGVAAALRGRCRNPELEDDGPSRRTQAGPLPQGLAPRQPQRHACGRRLRGDTAGCSAGQPQAPGCHLDLGGHYPGIPHSPTNARLAERATVHSTLDHRDDLFYEVRFPG